ncbi:uncharacterized protein F4812DRAFT_457005 [Daldinia caldariorum]|uniref:uncharacterized protein n=1 Tax=Daldinia caldariorum TaxID=326644 RepID=UPI0020074DEC|nr:uncharacterized protein F4812DRAFT_457005 [Daldinia caldariorum]KAI1469605.1 hypothetical protein F4812DRAFT_457005 [Daldinia caldariorum]
MQRVWDIIEKLERAYALPAAADGEELSLAGFTVDEIKSVERELVSAYRHNLVVISNDVRNRPFDVVSSKEVRVEEGEILKIQNECQEGAFCLGIYSELAMTGSDYFAQDATLIPGELLKEVEEHTGVRIADSIASTFTN